MAMKSLLEIVSSTLASASLLRPTVPNGGLYDIDSEYPYVQNHQNTSSTYRFITATVACVGNPKIDEREFLESTMLHR